MHPVLRKKIPAFWLIPIALIGLPFLLAAAGRITTALGNYRLGSGLVDLAIAYGVLPRLLLGVGSSDPPNTVLGYGAAGLFYALPAFACVACIQVLRRRALRE